MANTIRDGIEWFDVEGDEECQCARCGSSTVFDVCERCAGEGLDGHDCGEDTCCCADPEDNVDCPDCGGSCGTWRCCSTREYCEAHPMAGREAIVSTAHAEGEGNG